MFLVPEPCAAPRRALARWRAWFAAGLSCVAMSVSAVVPTPTVSGPIASDLASPDRNRTFFATDLDLKARGYVEEEYFYSGQANVYDATYAGGIGARPVPSPTASVVSSGHAYTTRMVVRRPASPERFNGVVVVEWTNATSGYDVEALWFRVHEAMLRDGYAWVGITAQSGPITNPTLGLKQFSPVRYGSLDLTAGGTLPTGDPLAYDVFAQGVQALRHTAVLGPLAGSVRQVIGAGVSQSAGRLSVYLNAVQPRDVPVLDAALLYIGGEKMRTDLPIPIIKLLSETEYTAPASANEITSLQPDTDRLRVWSMAGTSHSDWASFAVRYALLQRDQPTASLRDFCEFPSRSRIPDRYVIASALHWLTRWDATTLPPTSPPIALAGDGVTVLRDAYGLALGGIRLAPIEAPIAVDSGFNAVPPGSAGLCFLNGTHIPFDTATLNQLYPTRLDYLRKFHAAAYRNLAEGWVRPADVQEMIRDANVAPIGRGLDCGPLCANFAQFPIQPSTQLLRDHTRFLYMQGAAPVLRTLDDATRAVAQGYAARLSSVKVDRYSRAVALLRTYQGQIASQQQKRRVTPGQAALLSGYAATLIDELVKLGAQPAP